MLFPRSYRAFVLSFIFSAGAVQISVPLSAQNDTAGDVVTEVSIPEPRIDPTTVRTTPLSNSLFVVRDRVTEKRQESDRAYRLTYSHNEVDVNNYRLFAPHAPQEDVTTLLQNAIRFADAQNASEYRTSFRSSGGNLSLIVNAVGSTPELPTFNWEAYGAVAAIMLNDTLVRSSDRTASWVGTVSNPAGAMTAQVAIIPEIIVATIDPGPQPPTSTRTGPASPARGGRLAKRIVTTGRPVTGLLNPNTPYTISYGPRIDMPVGDLQALRVVMRDTVTTLRMNGADRVYTEFFGRDLAEDFVSLTQFDFDDSGRAVFRGYREPTHTFAFRLRPGVRALSADYMILMAEEIRQIAQENMAPFAITGTVLRGEQILAEWTLGGIAGAEATEGAYCPLQQRGEGGRPAGTSDRARIEDIASERACILGRRP
ncbi:MAG: hypothetical protein M1817_006632 [Caeruleum heppii]|nr:MAG: hypothetical protein M1817_006632 [Caeruleum heppii]